MSVAPDPVATTSREIERRTASALARIPLDPVELVDPPAGLWTRIEAALHDDPPGRPTGAGSLVEYRIDANDVIIGVGDGWAAFAEANEAPELADDVVGRQLWDGIEDGPLRDLWRAAVAAARASCRPSTVPFRCDGPSTRRWYEMTLLPGADGSVGFRSRLVFEMERPEVPELRRHDTATAGPTIQVCCWCAEACDGTAWRPVEEVLADSRALETTPRAVTHGFCRRCDVVARSELLAAR